MIIPCFNHGRFVADAVRSCLAQVDAELRIIVVDDGSDDGGSPAACDACAGLGPNIEVVHQANSGLPAARNAGARRISERGAGGWGDYLVFLDADDWIQPCFVSRLHSAVAAAADDRVSHAYCQERLVDKVNAVWAVPDWDPDLLLATNLHPVTALVRRSCFEAVGGFDPSMTGGYEDWDLWLRLAERGWRGVRVREPLFVWRRHSQNTMVVEAARRHDDLYAMLIDRHRALFRDRAEGALRAANAMIRRADASWLDESLQPIVLRDLRRWNDDLVRERDRAREHAKILEERLEHEPLEREARIRDEYERKLGVRAARAFFRFIDRFRGSA